MNITDLYTAPATQLAQANIPTAVTYTAGRGYHLAFGDGFQLQHPDETDHGTGWDLWQHGTRLLAGASDAVLKFWLGYLAGRRPLAVAQPVAVGA